MLRYIMLGSLCFLLSNTANLSWAKAVQNIPGCKNPKSYPLFPSEKLPNFPKHVDDDEIDADILEEYYANVAIAYATAAKENKQQAHEKRKAARQRMIRLETDRLRHGKISNSFLLNSTQRFDKKTVPFMSQLNKEATVYDARAQENFDKGKFYLCVAENAPKFKYEGPNQ